VPPLEVRAYATLRPLGSPMYRVAAVALDVVSTSTASDAPRQLRRPTVCMSKPPTSGISCRAGQRTAGEVEDAGVEAEEIVGRQSAGRAQPTPR
jgi:hypothetical protein